MVDVDGWVSSFDTVAGMWKGNSDSGDVFPIRLGSDFEKFSAGPIDDKLKFQVDGSRKNKKLFTEFETQTRFEAKIEGGKRSESC